MRVFGLAGWSGSGKTTLVARLVPELVRRGFSVSTMKHAHHDFDVDTPGKDSYEHRRAGATEVLVTSNNRWALMHELRGTPEPTPEALIQAMTPVDLLLIEGFKHYDHDKLEVHRQVIGKPFLYPEDERVVALASDARLDGVPLPVIDLNDIPAIADFIVAHCALDAGMDGGKRTA